MGGTPPTLRRTEIGNPLPNTQEATNSTSQQRSQSFLRLPSLPPFTHESPGTLHLSLKKIDLNSIRLSCSRHFPTPRSSGPTSPSSSLPGSPASPTHTPLERRMGQTFNDIQKFVSQFQEQQQILHATLEHAKQEGQGTPNEEESRFIAYQVLNPLSETWKDVYQKVDHLFQESGANIPLRKPMPRMSCSQTMPESTEPLLDDILDLHALGLDSCLEPHLNTSLKSCLAACKESIQGKPHLEIALNSLQEVLLDPKGDLFLFSNKANWKKLTQFQSSPSSIDYQMGFHYITHLIMIGFTLKQFKSTIPLVPGQNAALCHAQTFIDHIRRLEGPRNPESDEIPERCCEQYGDCLIDYAKHLAKCLRGYMEAYVEIPHYIAPHFPELTPSLERCVTLHSCESSFDTDFKRSILGDYLSLSSDPLMFPPSPTEETRIEDSEAYLGHQEEILRFFISHLGITEENIKTFNPLKRFQDTQSMLVMYQELEQAWRQEHLLRFFDPHNKGLSNTPMWVKNTPVVKIFLDNGFLTKRDYEDFLHTFKIELEATHTHASFNGIFKLLPILRIFQQSILLAPHTAIISMEKFLSNNTASHKVIGSCPKPDHETKGIYFNFHEEALTATIQRLGALADPMFLEGRQRLEEKVFSHCLIRSIVTLRASIHEMGRWEVGVKIVVERDHTHPNNLLPRFLKRYAELIGILEIMRLPYEIRGTSRP